MAMSKDKAVEMYSKTRRSMVTTRSSREVFAQGGHQCRRKMHSLCDGRLFSSAVAGRASDKADTQHIATSSGFIADDTECGHIDSPICPDSIEKHAVHTHKVVADEMLDDNVNQKMRIFNISGLEDKYLNTVLNRTCHS